MNQINQGGGPPGKRGPPSIADSGIAAPLGLPGDVDQQVPAPHEKREEENEEEPQRQPPDQIAVS